MTSLSNALVLGTEAVCSVHVHPTVIFQILDRALRRNEDQERVIGTLLGRVENGIAMVTNSFAVPHLETSDEVAVGKDYHTQMMALHRRVNENETVVGWYATSTAANAADRTLLDEHACLIHEFFGSVCEMPVHLVVDTSLQQDDVQVAAFVSTPLEIVDEAPVQQFKQVAVVQTVSEPEAIALQAMNVKAVTETKEDDDEKEKEVQHGTTTTLPSELAALDNATNRLFECLEQASAFVDDVVSGKVAADSKVGRELADALTAIPMLRADQFDQIFSSGLQDLLMVSYLSGLTQAQLSMAEKLINT